MESYGRDYRDRYGGDYRGRRPAGGGRRRMPPERRYGSGYPIGRRYGYGPPQGYGLSRARGRESDVDRVRVADIMTLNPEAVTPDTPLTTVATRMRELDVGIMPVVEDEDSYRLQGVVTDRDIAVRAAAEGKDMEKTQVREIMSSRPGTVDERAHVRDVLNVMKRMRVRRVPVVSADGLLVGIVAQADLAVNYAGLDLQRETEVEEVLERISEPARPRWGRERGEPDRRGLGFGRFRADLAFDLPERVRSGWRALRREAREVVRRSYDRGWR